MAQNSSHSDQETGTIDLLYCSTDIMTAGVLTRGLPRCRHQQHAEAMGLAYPSDPNGHPHPSADDTRTQEKAGRTREEQKNDESKQKRIFLVFIFSFIPIDLDLHPR